MKNIYRNMHSNLILNRKLLMELGPAKTCFLQLLIDDEPDLTPKTEIETEGWFYCSGSKLKTMLGLSDEAKIELEKTMIEEELLETRPVKNSTDFCYRLNWDKIQYLLEKE